VNIQNCIFSKQGQGIEIFTCNHISITNNIFKILDYGIKAQDSKLNRYDQNIILQINEDGLFTTNEENSIIQNNLFEHCEINAIRINPDIYPLGLKTLFNYQINFNDFKSNKTHIRVGPKGLCQVNENNFLKSLDYKIWTHFSTQIDSLNFQENFWQTVSESEIEANIYDRRRNPNSTQPIIDYRFFKTSYLSW
jgi:hypothetical protein